MEVAPMANKGLNAEKLHAEKKSIPFMFGEKHLEYIRRCEGCTYNVAEGAVRAGKTIDNVFAFAHELKTTPDKFHLATGSTMSNAKLNIGDANGFGLEYIFRGQCRWGQYRGNDALLINGPGTNYRDRIVLFAGSSSKNSFQKIRGNSYGMWIATEINLHHDSMIKEAFNRTVAAKRRKIFWDMNPDHPKAPIYLEYIDKYRDLAAEGKLLGGYNYEHFTIFDNVNISEERQQEIISQYDEKSVWYIRDILGQRSIADGLIYSKFAAMSLQKDNPLKITVNQAKMMSERRELLGITIGVDFGGNGSGHGFVCSAPTVGYKKLIALASELHTDKEIDPDDLGELLVLFVKRMRQTYGRVTQIYCDSAEPVLIRGMRKAITQAGMGNIPVMYALKDRINDRIFAFTSLCNTDRFRYTEDCETLEDALRTAVWNPKFVGMDRLDDGTSDIDSLDAFEYSYEHDIKYYIETRS